MEDTHTVSFQSAGVRKSMKVLSLKLDQMGGAAGALPNLIHSLDACLVHMVNLARIGLGMPWADIHDSFGSTVGDVKRTVELVNDAFTQVHTEFDINNVLRLHARPILSKGDLCLSELEQIVF
jgi:DNA-directed RNA polymerase